jgi:dihydrolipoamide dehydrogenase
MFDFDLIVIGSGPAGFSAAMRGLDYGKKNCIIEAGEIGGVGIMHGALTSKTMWELSGDYSVASRIDRGYRASGLNVDYDRVKNTVIQAAKERQYQMLSQIETFSPEKKHQGSLTLIRGYAKFTDRNTVFVKSEDGDKTLTAAYFVIATGSRPRKHPDFEIDGKLIVDSDSILDLEKFPKRIMIIGSGIIGCEFATIFSNFKQTEVHLLDRANRVIPFEDDDLSNFVSENLEATGIIIHHEASLRTIRKRGNVLEVVLDYESGASKVLEVDVALIAIGRVPNTENLGLENIGFPADKRGVLGMNDFCEINDLGKCNIYAAGDITGHGQLYNVAQLQGRYIVDSIFGTVERPISYENMSTLMFFKPEVAAVGFNEKQLQQKNIPYRVAYYSNELVSRAIAMRNTRGFVKIIASADGNGRILGMRASSPQASAFIVSVAHLIGEKNGLHEVNKTVHPHPGVTEGIEECLRLFEKSSVFKPEAFPKSIKYWEWKPEINGQLII